MLKYKGIVKGDIKKCRKCGKRPFLHKTSSDKGWKDMYVLYCDCGNMCKKATLLKIKNVWNRENREA